jgi:hypothetical protein
VLHAESLQFFCSIIGRMDPFAAIGLAGNIIAFLDFGFKLLSKSKDIYASASGALARHEDLALMTDNFRSMAKTIQISIPSSSVTSEELALHRLAGECEVASTDLIKLLDELKAKNPRSKRESLSAAFREWRRRDKVKEVESKLDQCRQQLNLQITSLLR